MENISGTYNLLYYYTYRLYVMVTIKKKYSINNQWKFKV